MNWVGSQSRAAATRSPAPERAGPRAERHRSLALAALVQKLPNGGVRVLDLGAASGTNIEFLSRYASKIQVEDLYPTLVEAGIAPEGDLPVGVQPEGEEPPAPPPDFDGLLRFSESATFDLILAWDLFDYLERDAIRALVGYLSRFCRPGSLLLSLSWTTKQIPRQPLRFRFVDAETLLYEFGSDEMRGSPRYTPRDFGLMMAGFRVDQSFLLKTGVQEYLFART